MGLHSPSGTRCSNAAAGTEPPCPDPRRDPQRGSPARREALPPPLLPPGPRGGKWENRARGKTHRSLSTSCHPPSTPACPLSLPSTPLFPLTPSPQKSFSPPQHPLSPLNTRSISFLPISTIPSAPPARGSPPRAPPQTPRPRGEAPSLPPAELVPAAPGGSVPRRGGGSAGGYGCCRSSAASTLENGAETANSNRNSLEKRGAGWDGRGRARGFERHRRPRPPSCVRYGGEGSGSFWGQSEGWDPLGSEGPR